MQELSAEERQKYLKKNKTQSALPKFIKAGFATLQPECSFTAGPDEVCPVLREGMEAPQAAEDSHRF